MTGIVTSRYEAILRIDLLNEHGSKYSCDAVVDTGYTGWITLPPSVVANLGLVSQRSGRAILADGSTLAVNINEAMILWDGAYVTVEVDEMDADSLVGMSMMYGYELVLPVLD